MNIFWFCYVALWRITVGNSMHNLLLYLSLHYKQINKIFRFISVKICRHKDYCITSSKKEITTLAVCSDTNDARLSLNWVDYCNAVLYGTSAVVIPSADYKWHSTSPIVSLFFATSSMATSASEDTVQNCCTDFWLRPRAAYTSAASPAQSPTVQAMLLK